MDLEQLIELGLPRVSPKGRGEALRTWWVRDLGEGDVDALLNPPKVGMAVSPIKTLRNSHHMLARCVAEGKSDAEASLITGYTTVRIRTLRVDPTFAELVDYYSTQVEAKYLNVHERLASLGMSTLDELQERLEAQPDSFKNRELMELAEFALDRSVTKDARRAGPQGQGVPAVAITFVNAQGSMQLPAEGGGGVAQNSSPLVIEGDPLP